jgi:anti-anti-sigma factor
VDGILENKTASLLNYTLEDREGIKILRVTGAINAGTRAEMERLVNALTQRFNLVMDMGGVTTVSSSGLKSLMGLCGNARNRGKRVLLMRAGIELVAMIERMEMQEFFIFIENVEEGRRKLRYYT